MELPSRIVANAEGPHSQKLPCPGSVLLRVAVNLNLKLLLDMVEPGAVKKAMSYVVGRCGPPVASARNSVPKASEEVPVT